MKILYRRELHKTTPTNFLYHVRLTYWLPLQLLWAELYLNLKGTQMGSPPVKWNTEEFGDVVPLQHAFQSQLSQSSICRITQVILGVEGFRKIESNLHLFTFSVLTLNVMR